MRGSAVRGRCVAPPASQGDGGFSPAAGGAKDPGMRGGSVLPAPGTYEGTTRYPPLVQRVSGIFVAGGPEVGRVAGKRGERRGKTGLTRSERSQRSLLVPLLLIPRCSWSDEWHGVPDDEARAGVMCRERQRDGSAAGGHENFFEATIIRHRSAQDWPHPSHDARSCEPSPRTTAGLVVANCHFEGAPRGTVPREEPGARLRNLLYDFSWPVASPALPCPAPARPRVWRGLPRLPSR
jgi:hypothetical protein